MLIENGVDVNAVNSNKQTALHYAAREGRVDVVNVLIKNGADLITLSTVILHFTSQLVVITTGR